MGRRNMLRCIASGLLNRSASASDIIAPSPQASDEAYHVVTPDTRALALSYSKSSSTSSIHSDESSSSSSSPQEEQEKDPQSDLGAPPSESLPEADHDQAPPPPKDPQDDENDGDDEPEEAPAPLPPSPPIRSKRPLSLAKTARRCLSLSALPSQDLEEDVSSEASSTRSQPNDRRRVSFSSLEIRSYKVILGDPHPYCSAGCSVSLDWQVQDRQVHELDSYEAQRVGQRRSLPDLRLTAEERNTLLDLDAADLRRASRRQHRARSSALCHRSQRAFFGATQEDEGSD